MATAKKAKSAPKAKPPHDLGEGEHCEIDGVVFYRVPGTDLVTNLKKHRITRHEDGTISAHPSIAVSAGTVRLHGWLKHGKWLSA